MLTWDELLRHLRFEYHAEIAAQCQSDLGPGYGMSQAKLDAWPTFYDWMVKRGVSRYKLSAHGIGRDIG